MLTLILVLQESRKLQSLSHDLILEHGYILIGSDNNFAQFFTDLIDPYLKDYMITVKKES